MRRMKGITSDRVWIRWGRNSWVSGLMDQKGALARSEDMVCCPASAIKKQLYLQKQMIQWRKKLNQAWWVCCNIRNRFIFSWASLSVRFIFPQLYSIACYIAKGKMESANLKFHQARQTFCNPIEEQPELILYWYICVFVYLCLCICVFVYMYLLCICVFEKESTAIWNFTKQD